MHILITRPEADADGLKARLEALGHTVSLAPLLTIVFEEIATDALSKVTALVATSRNGLRALATSQALATATALPVFAVGPATADLAHNLGFRDIVQGAGTAAGLVALIAAHPAARNGTVLHLAGNYLAYDLRAALSSRGIRLTTLPTYRSVAAEKLPGAVMAALAGGSVDAVILMSPRTAEIWAAHVKNLPVKADMTAVTYVCLSSAVAGALRVDLPDRGQAPKIEVAARPNAEEILALVRGLAAHSKAE